MEVPIQLKLDSMTTKSSVIENKVSDEPLLERHKSQIINDEQQLPPQRINCEQITLVWLDSQIDQVSPYADDIRLTEQRLRQLNDYVLLFSNETDCLTHIESIKNETVLLIMAGSCASSDLLEKMHKLRQIDSIFIFCQNKSAYNQLLSNKNYSKIVNVFDEQISLATSITRTIDQVDKQSAIFTLYNPNKQKPARDLHRESGSFIFLQLVKKFIHKMLPNEDAIKKSKQEMLEKCRLYYRDNKRELENIDRFEYEYTSDQAIKWYTNDSFIYKLINKALRTEDIEALYTYRFYISGSCACLAENCQLLREWISNITVYRGMKMSKVEIARLLDSTGHLIAVNGYFSTSRKQTVAEMFAGIGVNNSPKSGVFESVLFEIEVDLEKCPEIILADVQHLSSHRDEEELLFDLGTVFNIEAISFDDKLLCWKCLMLASNEGRAIAKEYLDFKQNELDKSNDIEVVFGDLLYDMGEWLKSGTYFENLAGHRPNDPQVHYGIARSHYSFSESDRALFHLKQAYDLNMKDKNECPAFAAKICSSISRAYHDCSNFTKALAFGDEALELYRRAGEHGNESGIAKLLINIGLVHFDKGNDDASLEHFERALQLLQRTYSFDSPEISDCYDYLSFAHYHKGDYEQALDCLLKSSQIDAQLVPANHPANASTENNIGKQYYKQGRYDEALQRFRHAADIDDRTLTNCNDGHIVVLNNIGKVLYRLNNFNEAIKYYEKALQLTREIFSSSPDHIYSAYTLKNKGEVLFAQDDFTGALELFEQAHDMYERIFARDGDHRDIAKCKHLIGLTYLARNDQEKATDMLDKALRMWINVLPQDHPDLGLGHRSMGELYMRQTNEEPNAIRHFQMALSIYEKRLPADDEQLKDLKSKVASLEHHKA